MDSRRAYAVEYAVLRTLACLVVAAPLSLSSQGPTVTVAIRVADTANAPVAGADVGVVRGTSPAIAHGLTDAAGRAMLTIPRDGGAHQLIVRKIGFQRGYRFFSLPGGDTLVLWMTLPHSVVALEAVRVSAEMDLKRKSYHLDAEDIENSSRTIVDGSDIFKLRPDMMNSRGGASPCEVYRTPRTGWIESVWVNGQRVTLAPVDSAYARERETALGIAPRPPRPNLSLSRSRAPTPPPPAFTVFSHMDTVLSILHGIKPEHIAEVTYKDCFDQTVGKNNSDLAMFIALKPGIGFRTGYGTYVVEDTAAAAPAAPTIDIANLPGYRLRVLGVFDGESGDPMPAVEVADSATGLRAKTTVTGTVSLYFVPEGAAILRLHKDGYRDTTLTFTIAPADTIPITAIMLRQQPPRPPFDLDSGTTTQYISSAWGDGREAEGGGLLNRYTVKSRIEGSNPSPPVVKAVNRGPRESTGPFSFATKFPP